MMAIRRRRVLFLLPSYPQLSETYIENEMRALDGRYDITVLALGKANLPTLRHHPYRHIGRQRLRKFCWMVTRAAPDVIHGHWLSTVPQLYRASELTGVGFTVRSHSFDVLGNAAEHFPAFVPLLNSPRCLGVLAFPFAKSILEAAGVHAEKIIAAPPVIDFARFHDEGANGDGVMNLGACIPKKAMDSYLELARRMPGTTFRLYPIGYHTDALAARNAALGSPVEFAGPLQPEMMPAEYKRHRWLVYTASEDIGTVGWPMAVAEAQAAGVGVVMQRIRPDLDDYVGPAGYTFRTLDEAREIISRPFPEARRQLGFEQARRCDILTHVPELERLWDKQFSGASTLPRTPFRRRLPLAFLYG